MVIGSVEVTNMTERHLMLCTDSNGDQSHFECMAADCGRKLIFDHVNVRLMVLTPGNPFAMHQGSTGGVGLSAELQSPEESS